MWVLLKLFYQEQLADRSVCETPSRVLNQSSTIIQIMFFLVLACVFDSQTRKSPRGEINRAAWLITRGEVVLRLRGSNRVDWKPDRFA
jgi:hypothetical protein